MAQFTTIGAPLAFLAVALAFTVDLHAQTNANEYKPSWFVGQQWRVETEQMSEEPQHAQPKEQLPKWTPHRFKTLYQLTVEEITEVDGASCSRIRIECISTVGVRRGDVFYRIFVRQSDGTLKMVQRLRGAEERVVHTRKFRPVPVHATTRVGALAMAWPSFALEEGKHVPTVRHDSNTGLTYRDSDECSQTQENVTISVNGKETEALQVVLEKTQGPNVWRTTQTWVKGKPWWVEARHERSGTQERWCSARLLAE